MTADSVKHYEIGLECLIKALKHQPNNNEMLNKLTYYKSLVNNDIYMRIYNKHHDNNNNNNNQLQFQ